MADTKATPDLDSMPISGEIVWRDKFIYPGITPIFLQHYTELDTYVLKVDQAIDFHKNLKSVSAHPLVTAEYSGFFPPTMFNDIENLNHRIAELESKVYKMIPDGIIIMYAGYTDNLPEGWYWCNRANPTIPESRGKFFLGAGNDNQYPLHETTNQGSQNIANVLATPPQHRHQFINAYYSERHDYFSDPHYGWENVGASWTSYDRKFAYFYDNMDYAGTAITADSISRLIQPYHVKVPYILRNMFMNKKYTITVTQPSTGSILINGVRQTSVTVPQGSIIGITVDMPISHELINCTVNGVQKSLPYWTSIQSDINIVGTSREKLCSITVNQAPNSVTLVNNVKITTKNYLYGSSISVKCNANADYACDYFTVDFRGYTVKVSAKAAASKGIKQAAIDEIDKLNSTQKEEQ